MFSTSGCMKNENNIGRMLELWNDENYVADITLVIACLEANERKDVIFTPPSRDFKPSPSDG